jgi:hypothetical protein
MYFRIVSFTVSPLGKLVVIIVVLEGIGGVLGMRSWEQGTELITFNTPSLEGDGAAGG